MTVLSLFNGCGCGLIALERAGIKVSDVYISEIDKYANAVNKYHFPNSIQLGDVSDVSGYKLPKIDLIIGGSPCQGFSSAGLGLGLEDPRSKLFFEFVRILKECRERNGSILFLLENVVMKGKNGNQTENVISEFLGVQPQLINSNLFSAQNRPRLYWSDIATKADIFGNLTTNFQVPRKQYPHVLKDVLQEDFDDKYFLSETALSGFCNRNEKRKGISGFLFKPNNINKKSNTILKGEGTLKCEGNYVQYYTHAGHDSQTHRVYFDTSKSATLSKTNTERQHVFTSKSLIRKLTPLECERLQTLPEGYTSAGGQISDTQRYAMIGNGWTVDLVAHLFSQIIKKNEFN
jgi:DNA-cytosine methyltransferase